MKKIIYLLLALVLALSLCFSLVSCNDESDDGDDTGVPENPFDGDGGIELPIIPLG